MANDRDLKDACVGQGLTPLRLTVITTSATNQNGETAQQHSASGDEQRDVAYVNTAAREVTAAYARAAIANYGRSSALDLI
ncbi:hypothetical protein R1flu_022799 [Riccia fluitans]|uniref:Uncharacterized protein n=1 Tax=Riccia fluitans TaxID=41844 RepID=A0ABD1XQ80_9MARC